MPPLTVEEAIAHAVAAALRRDRFERRERRRLRHERDPEARAARERRRGRSRSPRRSEEPGAEAAEVPVEPQPEEDLYPEDWLSPVDEVEAGPPGVFEVPSGVPGPRTPENLAFPATSAKYGGVPTLISSGSSHSFSDAELRSRLQRHSSAAASDAAWDGQEQESPSPPRRRMPRLPDATAHVHAFPPEPPRAPTFSAEPPAGALPPPALSQEPPHAASPLPGFPLGLAYTRRHARYPRGHPMHAGPRLLFDPSPPHHELCRKFNRMDCTGVLIRCPHDRRHACSQCGGDHPAPQCWVEEGALPPPDPPQGPPRRH